MTELISISDCFLPEGKTKTIVPFGDGLINSTYRVTLKNDINEFVLQKINHQIFLDIELLQKNIKLITEHIRHKLQEAGETDLDRKTLTLIPTKNGKLYHFDGENYWRMTLLIPDAKTYQVITPEYAYFAGKAFGHFQAMLSDIPEPLGETIPDFHNMEFRLKQFRDAVAQNAAGRLSEVGDLVAEIEKRADEMCICEQLYREGKLLKRINHCDTKVNNMLFDEDGKVLCVIDLDTAMPGFVVSDYGDFMRSAGNRGKEDDTNLSNVSFNMEIFKAYTKGYLEEAQNFLTPLEIELLPFGAKLITYMQLTRFLTDYLNGDIYYKINSFTHNLERSRAQLKLLKSIEENYCDMQGFINNLVN
ncbi:MAG: aminoglycoside phosphotransferase family protein [Prolixibacteraceae bacterium]|nr:aminoglycoside phosphotransferase family protein [Prolixibacteraceae bacterium]